MPTSPQLTDQIANISPIWIVAIVTAFTLLRIALAKTKEPWARAVAETCDTVNFVLILAFLLVRPFVAQAFYIPSASMRQTLLEGDRLIVDKLSYRMHEPKVHDVVVFNAPKDATDEHIDGIDFIKRLIAGPNQTIEVRAAKLQIGDEVITWDGVSGVHDYLRGRLNLTQDDSIKLFPDSILINSTQKIGKAELMEKLGVTPGMTFVITPGQTLVDGKVQSEPFTREDPSYSHEPVRIKENELYMLGDNRNQSRDSHVWGPLERQRVVGRALCVFWPIPRTGAIR